MKIKLFICTFLVMVFTATVSVSACHFKFWGKKNVDKPVIEEKITQSKETEQKDLEILAAMDSKSSAVNQVWVGTFQLLWNDLIDEIIKHPIEFVGYKSLMAESLNKKAFTIDELSDAAYYKKWGLVSADLKNEIEKGIKDRFNETSDVLDSIDWTPAPEKYLLYAMLKKDFEYIKPFDKLEDGDFKGSDEPVKYFGVDRNTKYDVRNSVGVMFYNNSSDYAVSLESKQGDIVYLYRTNDDKTLSEYYRDMNDKSAEYKGSIRLKERDRFKAPVIDFKAETSFPELCNKPIKNSDFIISQAIETIKFKMDETGVKLKSEAAIVVGCTALPMPVEEPRYFYFNDKYVIFIKEKNKEPYFAMKVADAKKLQ